MEHARKYYVRPDGSPTSEFDNYCQALRPLKKLYGTTAACEFGPKALRALQQEMIGLRWCRSNINKQINRLNWGVNACEHARELACDLVELIPAHKASDTRLSAAEIDQVLRELRKSLSSILSPHYRPTKTPVRPRADHWTSGV